MTDETKDGAGGTTFGALQERGLAAAADFLLAGQEYWAGLQRYLDDFMVPFANAAGIWMQEEVRRLPNADPQQLAIDYTRLLAMNLDILLRAMTAGTAAVNGYLAHEAPLAERALRNSAGGAGHDDLADFAARQERLARMVLRDFPAALDAVAAEYGFHFEQGRHPLFAESDRFLLYRVTPTDPKLTPRPNGKPLIIVPPYVLGSNILAFLPAEKRSYAHAFADQGIPTYIRVMKPIHDTPAVQLMTPEDDARDTRVFCEKVKAEHGRAVTLNGYCQGGFSAVCNILTGELDGLVDALLTCVSPMDGTKSHGLAGFLRALPPRFNDLAYGTKRLPSGNYVADGTLMGWVYKLKSIEAESPVAAFHRDLSMFAGMPDDRAKIGKSAAAITYWLRNERTDLPLPITRMSFASYNEPVRPDGTLPVRVLDRELNFKRITAKGIPWLICYGEKDDLVEPETALAPTAYVPAEVTAFPRGHVAIATSWSHPESAHALHLRHPDGRRGPVRFQLDLDAAGGG
ncbi:MAG: metal transporter [Deltaproteobacteria bacterium]|nr:metal transporter [Deltaproteobacteria bacterium]